MKNFLIIACILFLSFDCNGKEEIQPEDIKSELKHIAYIKLNSVRSVALMDKIVFIVGAGELASADISDPYNPKILSKVPLEQGKRI